MIVCKFLYAFGGAEGGRGHFLSICVQNRFFIRTGTLVFAICCKVLSRFLRSGTSRKGQITKKQLLKNHWCFKKYKPTQTVCKDFGVLIAVILGIFWSTLKSLYVRFLWMGLGDSSGTVFGSILEPFWGNVLNFVE